jgi:hypothetical protein
MDFLSSRDYPILNYITRSRGRYRRAMRNSVGLFTPTNKRKITCLHAREHFFAIFVVSFCRTKFSMARLLQSLFARHTTPREPPDKKGIGEWHARKRELEGLRLE